MNDEQTDTLDPNAPGARSAQPWWATPNGIAKAVRDAEDRRDEFLVATSKLREVFVGPDYGRTGNPSFEQTQNPVFSLMSLMLPDLFTGEPEGVADVDPGSPEEILGLAVMHAANITAKKQDALGDFRMAAIDAMMGFGCIYTELAPSDSIKLSAEDRMSLHQPLGPKGWDAAGTDSGETEPQPRGVPLNGSSADPWEPRMSYIQPERCFYDMRRVSMKEREYAGHDVTMTLDELEQLAEVDRSWDIHAIRQVRRRYENASDHKLAGLFGGTANSDGDVGYREFVTFKQVWVRTARIEGTERGPNEQGVCYTIWMEKGARDSAIELRKPYYAKSSPRGPYHWFAHIWSGVDAFPLSPLLANKVKIDLANAATAASIKAIREQKRVYLIDGSAAHVVEDVERATDGGILPVENLGEAAMQEIVRGGLYPEMLQAVQYFDTMLARDLGVDAALRGSAEGGDVTATETSVAAAATDKRIADFRRSIRRSVAGVFRELGWLIAHSADFVVRARQPERESIFRAQLEVDLVRPGKLDRPAARRAARIASEAQQLLLQGGDFARNDGLDFDSIAWNIEVIEDDALTTSERRMRDQARRAEIAQINQLALEQPFYDWSFELREIERAYGTRGVFDRFDPELASQIAQMQITQVGFRGGVSVQPSSRGESYSVEAKSRPDRAAAPMVGAASMGQRGPVAQPGGQQSMPSGGA